MKKKIRQQAGTVISNFEKLNEILSRMPLTRKALDKRGYTLATPNFWLKKVDQTFIETMISLDVMKNIKENNHISLNFTNGNDKLHGIGSIALSPWKTCKNKKCFKSRKCYGTHAHFVSFNKFVYQIENTLYLMEKPKEFEKQINAYLALNKTMNYFRWHENGDFPNAESVAVFDRIARKNKKVHFLAMTKQYQFVNEYLKTTNGVLSKNFMIRMSKFELDGITKIENPYNLPTTDVIKKGQKLEPGQFLCPGVKKGCASCLACWHTPLCVVFEYHP